MLGTLTKESWKYTYDHIYLNQMKSWITWIMTPYTDQMDVKMTLLRMRGKGRDSVDLVLITWEMVARGARQ